MNLSFVGDISCTEYFMKKYLKMKVFCNEVLDNLNLSDEAICNLEGPTTNAPNIHCPNVDVKSPINTLDYLSERNFSIYNLANNHIFDCDKSGLDDTIEQVRKNKHLFFGAGDNVNIASQPIYLKKKNLKIGLIALGQGHYSGANNGGIFGEEEIELLKKRVAEVRKSCDWIILNYHGGEEFTHYPMPSRRKKLRDYLKLGIDIVIAHHSHTFQGVEYFGNKAVFYSLGNFVFDIDCHNHYPSSNYSAILNLKFSKYNFHFPLNLFYRQKMWTYKVVRLF